ncbi:MAG: Fic family protein [Phycisphaeraceae bacterium]|nr:Fic family protein [Phycisphaeraceae bacterium]
MRVEPPPFSFEQLPHVSPIPEHARRRFIAEYRPWRKLRYLAEEEGVKPEDAWVYVKAWRRDQWIPLPVSRCEGGKFGFVPSPSLYRLLHLIDRAAGDGLIGHSVAAQSSLPMRKRLDALLKRGELFPARMLASTSHGESAESSIMEGASATRKEAMEMLRSGRSPRTLGERMILNNFHAMRMIKEHLREPLSLELLLEVQSVITAGTLEPVDGVGRLRSQADDVRVVDTRDQSTLFVPPNAGSLRVLLSEICAFANESHDGTFLHPIVRAAALHFLIGYAHPFVDGNGRTARAFFYWSMLRSGYSLFEYLSISEIIRKGYSRYPQAFVDVEDDDGDLTYFVQYTLEVLEQALGRFSEHLAAEELRLQRSERFLAIAKDLNLRQRLLLEHALRHPGTAYTVKSHSNSNGITLVTARTDLDDLVRRRLMTTSKRGKEVLYHVTATLRERLAKKGM